MAATPCSIQSPEGLKRGRYGSRGFSCSGAHGRSARAKRSRRFRRRQLPSGSGDIRQGVPRGQLCRSRRATRYRRIDRSYSREPAALRGDIEAPLRDTRRKDRHAALHYRTGTRGLDEASPAARKCDQRPIDARSEEHTSELQSLMRISYAVFCLKKKTKLKQYKPTHTQLHSMCYK